MSNSGWEVRFSNSKQIPYFYHAEKGTSTWEPPSEISQEQLHQLPGASKYLTGNKNANTGNQSQNGQVRASHILAKHSGSRRPSSWRQENITITKEEAQKIIEQHVNTLKSLPPSDVPAEFAKIASTESDCSSARKGGDLGWFGRNQMQKPFEDATFGLEVGQLSDVISTDSGIHVILRTG
ncbi:uncharacterized protein L201_001113 [Kwoniella dendrophila CBS 6074]|uniref:Peptidyl-prolyl cis-trans isomerase n=1 Tax=Kwoniella dendrophila CBS 6074 TaxID=1295534 RepID=A0AAX4JNV6_9TREE